MKTLNFHLIKNACSSKSNGRTMLMSSISTRVSMRLLSQMKWWAGASSLRDKHVTWIHLGVKDWSRTTQSVFLSPMYRCSIKKWFKSVVSAPKTRSISSPSSRFGNLASPMLPQLKSISGDRTLTLTTIYSNNSTKSRTIAHSAGLRLWLNPRQCIRCLEAKVCLATLWP